MSDKKRVGTSKCGFCMTGNHEHCVPETSPFFGRTWKCTCSCAGKQIGKATKTERSLRPAVVIQAVESDEDKAVRVVAQQELDRVLSEVQSEVEELLK